MQQKTCCRSWCTNSARARGENSPPRSSEDIRGLVLQLTKPTPPQSRICRRLKDPSSFSRGNPPTKTSVKSKAPLPSQRYVCDKCVYWDGGRTQAGSASRLKRPRWSTMLGIDHHGHKLISSSMVIIPNYPCQSRHRSNATATFPAWIALFMHALASSRVARVVLVRAHVHSRWRA
jgi:hypothetical protein